MTMWVDDDRLESVLRSIGAHLETAASADDGASSSPAPLTFVASRRPTRRWLAAAAAVLVAVGVGVATPVGESVARWFGIGTLQISLVPPGDITPLPTETILDDTVTPIEPEAAWRRAGLDRSILEASDLGVPDEFGVPPDGGVLFAWATGDTVLWVRGGSDPRVGKKVVEGDRVDVVPALGDEALLVDGPHVLETPSRRLRAGRVLWWIAGDREYRLESTLPGVEMIDVARSLTP